MNQKRHECGGGVGEAVEGAGSETEKEGERGESIDGSRPLPLLRHCWPSAGRRLQACDRSSI